MERIVHPIQVDSPWYVSQVGRAVVVFRKSTGEEVKRLEPPSTWGNTWTWNFMPDGRAIYFMQAES